MKATTWIPVALLFCAIGVPCSVPAQTVPEIDVEVVNDDTVVVSWPDQAPGFILQQSSSPSDVGVWQGIPLAPVSAASRMTVSRPLDSLPTRWFVRIRAKGPNPGLDYLVASQNPSGTWGNPAYTEIRDTLAALEALGLTGDPASTASAFAFGLAGLSARPGKNNDDTSRKAIGLATNGYDVEPLITELLASQNDEVLDATAVSYPGRGWGLARGFGNCTIDTALVLRALESAGIGGGLTVFSETVPAAATSAAHPFAVPAGATDMFLKVRSVSGASLRFNLNQPGGGSLFVDVAPRTTTLNVGPIATSEGTWSLTVDNSSATAASYTAEVGFTGPDAFSVFRFTTALTYLAMAQNADGGWGIAPAEDSHLMITTEVLRALAAAGNPFVAPQVFSTGVAWLLTHQNADGGFSSEPDNSNTNETSLALLAIKAAGPGTPLGGAPSFLRSQQLPDGSWGSSSYETAMAVQALYFPPVVDSIPNQTVAEPNLFAAINLDDFVDDPDNPDNEIAWIATGQSVLSVSIVNRVATITYAPGTRTTETITFTATDPGGSSDSTSASFTVAGVDYTIARGGSVPDAKVISADAAVMAQVATFTEAQIGVPPGITYTRTGAAFISATEIQIDFQIAVAAGANPGIYSFQVDYEFSDGSGNPLAGPFTGDTFNISLEVTP